MTKLTLNDLANLTNETSAINTINTNNDLIEQAIENTLSRDGTSPNSMGATLDMNSNRIINLPAPAADDEPVRKIDLENAIISTGGGDATTVAPLSQFAATTSAQLAGVITDETGTGKLVFGTSPTLTTPNILTPTMTAQGGSEGGELHLQKPASGSTLVGDIVIDSAANLFRVFDGGTPFKGMYADITTLGNAVSSRILTSTDISSTVQPFDADLTSWAGVTRASGFDTFAATPSSANLAALVTNETGTAGSLVFSASPTLSGTVTVSGTVAATTVTGDGSGVTNLNAANLATNTVPPARLGSGTANSTTFLRGDNTWQTIPSGGNALTSNPLSQFAATTSAQLAGVISDETGSGNLVFATSPTLVTPVLGVATATTINGTSIPASSTLLKTTDIGTSVQGYDADLATWASVTRSAGFDTFATTPSSANFAALLTNETGTAGSVVFSTAPTLIGPVTVSGTVAATTVTGDGAGVTNIAAGNIATGTVGTARLGSGTANSTTFLRGDNTWQTIAGGGNALTANPLSQFAATTSAQLAGVISDETGSGALVFGTSPTLTTPVLGVATATSINGTTIPSSAVLLTTGTTSINGTTIPAATTLVSVGDVGVSVQGYDADLASWAGVTRATGFDTFTATPTSANLAALVTNETGSGALMFGTSPSVTTDIRPATNNGAALGTSALGYSTLFLGTGGVINMGAGAVTMTHVTGGISVLAGTNFYSGDANPPVSNIVGWGLNPSGKIGCTVDSGQAADFNRKTNDGTIVNFKQDGTTEGAVQVAGTLLTYATFTGSHWSQLSKRDTPKILKGTVVDSIDEMCEWEGEDPNLHLPRFKINDTPGSKRVYGVFLHWDEEDDYKDALIVSLGTYVVRISKGIPVSGGDLLEATGDGCARPQGDDIIRSSTIGKVTSSTIVEVYEDGSYLVPCVLYCG